MHDPLCANRTFEDETKLLVSNCLEISVVKILIPAKGLYQDPPPHFKYLLSSPLLTMSLATLPPFRDIGGDEVSADIFKGKVVFAMNVASACGYTKDGYDLFARLTEKYSPDDFIAVAIPCNAFGSQESGSPAQVKAFALARADKLLITEKTQVNGDDAHPIIKAAKEKFPGEIEWNFDGRYVFDRDGAAVARFGHASTAEQVEGAIDSAM